MQVLAVGRWSIYYDFAMQISGFIVQNPKVGGLGQDVTYSKNKDFC